LDNEILFIEGALFSAGKPLSVKELSLTLNLPSLLVRRSLRKLMRLYSNRKSALQVVRVGNKYGMNVRTEFQDVGQKFAPARIPRGLLKILSFVAYKQPIKQSALVNLMGYKVYESIKKLRKLGLVHRQKEGHTYILKTSSRFSEQFGIGSTETEDVKDWVREQLSNSYEELTGKKLGRLLTENEEKAQQDGSPEDASVHEESEPDEAEVSDDTASTEIPQQSAAENGAENEADENDSNSQDGSGSEE